MHHHTRSLLSLVAALALAAGCVPAPSSTGTTPTRPRGTAEPTATPAPDSPVAAAYTGKVLGLDGQPAAGVTVRGYLLSNNGGNLVSNNGAGFRVLAEGGLEVVTGADGSFKLAHPEGKPLNLEAVQSATVKAIRFNVAADASGLSLQLAKTGTITGKVSAPDAPSVSDFEGVDIFVPGTGYSAKAAKDGSFTIANVPAGSFTLVASKTGLGRAEALAVKVESEKATSVNLALSVAAPVLSAVSPANGGPGAALTLTGENFGATAGKTFTVTIGGVAISAPERVDDKTLKLIVPAGANSGDVVVTVDGMPSNARPFTVIQSFYIPVRTRAMKVGQVSAPEVLAVDAKGEAVASPAVSWSLTGEAATLEAGKLVAKAVGQVTLKATSGSLSQETVLKVFDAPAVFTTVAGGPVGNQDGIGTEARFYNPGGIAMDAKGNLYMADTGNHTIRKVTPEGRVSTFAGTGTRGYTDGPGASAQFNEPEDVAVDAAGNVYVADRYNHRIRKITPAGVVSTVAGDGTAGLVNGKGAAARLNYPHVIELGPDGQFYLGEDDAGLIRRMTNDGTVYPFSGAGVGDAEGAKDVAKFSGAISGLVFDKTGNLYVSDGGNRRIRKVTPEGTVSTLAGSTFGIRDGSGAEAQFQYLGDLAYDGANTLFVGEALALYDKGTPNVRTVTLDGGVVKEWRRGGGYMDGPLDQAKFWHISGICFTPQGDLMMLETDTTQASYLRLIRFFK